jgi:hypothetical protein
MASSQIIFGEAVQNYLTTNHPVPTGMLDPLPGRPTSGSNISQSISDVLPLDPEFSALIRYFRRDTPVFGTERI